MLREPVVFLYPNIFKLIRVEKSNTHFHLMYRVEYRQLGGKIGKLWENRTRFLFMFELNQIDGRKIGKLWENRNRFFYI
jgi:hypothetical protein